MILLHEFFVLQKPVKKLVYFYEKVAQTFDLSQIKRVQKSM